VAAAERPELYIRMLLLVVLLGFSGVWAFSAFAPNMFMDQDYGQWTAKMSMIQDCQVGDATIIGDSRASAAFVPAMLGQDTVKNLALTGATPIEVYYEVKKILACPKPPHVIVMSFASEQYEDPHWFWLHAARYGFFSFADLEDVRRTETELGEPTLYKGAFGTELPGNLKNWLYVNGFPPFNFASMLAAHGAGRSKANDLIRAQTLASGGQHLEGTAACATKPGSEASLSDFRPNRLIVLYLERLVHLIDERPGTSLWVMSVPISAMTAQALVPSYRAGYVRFLDSFKREHPDVQIVGEPFPEMNDCMFGDSHHVNEHGAEAYSRQVAPIFTTALRTSQLVADHAQRDLVPSATRFSTELQSSR
jgi:hypothetical protein